MKEKIIAMLMILLLLIFAIIFDFKIFVIAIALLSCLSFLEFFNYKYKNKKIGFMKIVCLISMLFIVFNNIFYNLPSVLVYVLPLIFMIIPVIIYDKNNQCNFNDIMYLYGVIVFLALSYSIMISIYKIDVVRVIYIVIIAFMCDIYSYIGTKLIGRHKVRKTNRTVEGNIFGIIMTSFIGAVIHYNLIGESVLVSILISFILSIASIVGDMLFYNIKSKLKKEEFKVKIIDQFDSIILISLIYMIIINIL